MDLSHRIEKIFSKSKDFKECGKKYEAAWKDVIWKRNKPVYQNYWRRLLIDYKLLKLS